MVTSLVARRSSLVGRSARSCLLFAGFSAFCADLPAQTQPAVTIATRSFADSGYFYAPGEGCPDGQGYRVYETAIAVNGDYQMEVSISAIPTIVEGAFVPCSPEDKTRIRYGFRDAESSSWTSGFLREFEFDPNARVEDPSIAPGPGATEFIIVSKTGDSIFATTFDAATGTSTPWLMIFPPPQGATVPVDKPWIVRAAASTYHVAFMEGLSSTKVRLLTTLDGGASWIGGQVTVSGISQGSAFCPQPALHSPSQTLFLTARFGADLRILRRIGGATSSTYEELLKPGGSPILTRIELYDSSLFSETSCLPMPHPANAGNCMQADFMHSGTMPYLTGDPTSSARLYLAHNDRGHPGGVPGESTDPSDVDVVLKRIERVSTDPERWDVTSTVRVPHCAPPSGCATCTFVAGDPCAHPDARRVPTHGTPTSSARRSLSIGSGAST